MEQDKERQITSTKVNSPYRKKQTSERVFNKSLLKPIQVTSNFWCPLFGTLEKHSKVLLKSRRRKQAFWKTRLLSAWRGIKTSWDLPKWKLQKKNSHCVWVYQRQIARWEHYLETHSRCPVHSLTYSTEGLEKKKK